MKRLDPKNPRHILDDLHVNVYVDYIHVYIYSQVSVRKYGQTWLALICSTVLQCSVVIITSKDIIITIVIPIHLCPFMS